MTMIKIPFNQEMIDTASIKAKQMGTLNNSILKGGGNNSGFLGELALADFLSARIVSDRSYGHDLEWQNKRIEVKTKRVTTPPLPHYLASVSRLSLEHQRPDYFVFVRIQFKKKMINPFDKTQFQYFRPKVIWVTGFKNGNDFLSEATLRKAGEINPNNNFRCVADEYTIPLRDLENYEEFVYKNSQYHTLWNDRELKRHGFQ